MSRKKNSKSNKAREDDEDEEEAFSLSIRRLTVRSLERSIGIRLRDRDNSYQLQSEYDKQDAKQVNQLKPRDIALDMRAKDVVEHVMNSTVDTIDPEDIRHISNSLFSLTDEMEAMDVEEYAGSQFSNNDEEHKEDLEYYYYDTLESVEYKPGLWEPCVLNDSIAGELIGNSNLDMTELIRNVFETVSIIDTDLDEKDKQALNDNAPWRDLKLVDLEDDSLLANIQNFQPWREAIYKEPIFQAVINSDIKAYYDEVGKLTNLECHEVKDGSFEISPKCLCGFEWWFKSRNAGLNLLYVAAAVSTLEFIESMTSSLIYLEEFELREKSEYFIRHYEFMINKWATVVIQNTSPVSAAAEFGRIEVIMPLLKVTGKSALTGSKYYEPSLLSNLVYSSLLHKIDRHTIGTFFDFMHENQILYALDVAAQVGCQESIKIIKENMSAEMKESYNRRVSLFQQPHFVPGRINPNGTFKNKNEHVLFPHFLAQDGNIDQFKQLQPDEKIQPDRYGWTPLVSLLNCPDEEIEKELIFFRRAKKEDLFIFIAQIIVKNRIKLLKEALKITFSNPENFRVRRNVEYRRYGLQSYIELPMETALSRTGNMILVESIAEFYSRQDEFARQIIKEDALRCIKSIQDKATRLSEHIRLSVIFMMIKFVDTKEDGFEEVMRLHSYHGNDDRVERFIMENFIKSEPRHRNFGKKVQFIPWKTAFNMAAETINALPDIYLEDELPTNILKRQKVAEVQVLKSILVTPQEAERKKMTKNEDRYLSHDEVYGALAEALTRIDQLSLRDS